ncbi:MAG: Fic family protein [Acidobacteria bacterium]|nr:Fic family protein [Acidobacteriota bacterium]
MISSVVAAGVAADARIAAHCSLVTAGRYLVDRHLRGPARWRGPLRREVAHRRPQLAARARIAETFNTLVESADALPQPDVDFVCQMHDQVAGGRAFRALRVRVGSRRGFPSARVVGDLVEEALRRANTAPSAELAAMTAHFDLLSIHPFADGNGRTARMVASSFLLRAGYRSTLFTAVEQHWHDAPHLYAQTWLRHDRDDPTARPAWISAALQAMVRGSCWAIWFRRREDRLRRLCEAHGVVGGAQETELVGFDLGLGPGGRLLAMLLGSSASWREVRKRLPATVIAPLLRQLERLRLEQVADACGTRDWRELRYVLAFA